METVEDIVREMRGSTKQKYCSSKHCCVKVYNPILDFADRIDAAHRREVSELKKKRGCLSTVSFVKIIENLVAGDMIMAVDYAERMIQNAERKYGETADILDCYGVMTARDVLHILKGEPKEGCVAVLDTKEGADDGNG